MDAVLGKRPLIVYGRIASLPHCAVAVSVLPMHSLALVESFLGYAGRAVFVARLFAMDDTGKLKKKYVI